MEQSLLCRTVLSTLTGGSSEKQIRGTNQTNIEGYTESVISYIAKCKEDVTVQGNQKPWMTPEVRLLLKDRDAAFRGGGKAAIC